MAFQGPANEVPSIRQGCRPGSVDVGWQDTFSEIKVLLKTASIRHQQASRVEQILQREFRWFPVPPGTGTVSWLSFEVRGTQWAFRADALHDMLCERLVGTEPGSMAAAGGGHTGQAEAIIFHRQIGGSMRPVLQELPLLALGTVKLQRLVRRQARPEHMMVRPFNNRNGIDLDITQALHDLWHRVRLQLGGQGAQCQPSGLDERQVRHGSHRLTLLQKPSYWLRDSNSAMLLPAIRTRFKRIIL